VVSGWTVSAQDGQLPAYIAVRPPQGWSGEESVVAQLQPVSGEPVTAVFALVVAAAEPVDMPDVPQQPMIGDDMVVEPAESAPPTVTDVVEGAQEDDLATESPQETDDAVEEEELVELAQERESEVEEDDSGEPVPETEEAANEYGTPDEGEEEGESLLLLLDEEGGIVFDAPAPETSEDVPGTAAPAEPETDAGDVFGDVAGEGDSLGLDLLEEDADSLDELLPPPAPSAHPEPTSQADEIDTGDTSGYAPSTADVMREIGMEMTPELM